ncbi:MAG: hydrogenase maturation protease [Xanthomonadales bacterium]|nr:hydrogenase maturation protease [Gammaproteobacteria bacterium]MBT8049858.1 hydrogenase maturation protease [Gammaproteobacteria bacterium]MBT8056215.1 hydrogenase maturation protease [Gammaproteobacteria bacterium]NNJ78577.1 hydrogenase maturation protease [Xanthomonadales bacterium]NNL04285.1 hydrogenase maturation protease [Xanthomonadales bacterium]
MDTAVPVENVLVMGVGNTLMQDDGVGIEVTRALTENSDRHPSLRIVDGGTIGLALLPEIEDADAVIVVDASELGAPPGTLQLFHNEEIDALLSGKRRTVHEVALLDLFAAAAIGGRLPARRTLVAIQPGCTDWGSGCTGPVREATLRACTLIEDLVHDWTQTGVAA